MWRHLNDYARKSGGTDCPACGRKVEFKRRRINKNQAETFVAICRETYLVRSQSTPRPWVHVERELVARGYAPTVGGDWTFLKFWGLIEAKPDPVNPGGHKAGYWRVTEFGLEVFNHPKREILRSYVETFNNQKRGQADQYVSLVARLGRSFEPAEEIRRAA